MYRAVRYNPLIHHRRSIRLKGYDYSRPGYYFITICCQDHECRFGHVENHTMVLNQFGIIAQNEWYKLPGRFRNLQLDVFVVMPNHIHAIIKLNDITAGATLAVAPTVAPDKNDDAVAPDENDDAVAIVSWAGASPAPATLTPSLNPTVGNIIGAYKSLGANECLKICKSKNKKMGKLWQRNYYEIIIRNNRSYYAISKYILNNPAKWKGDKFLQ